jgi:hypothetical protein
MAALNLIDKKLNMGIAQYLALKFGSGVFGF